MSYASDPPIKRVFLTAIALRILSRSIARSILHILGFACTNMQVAHVCSAYETCPCHVSYCVWRSFHATFSCCTGSEPEFANPSARPSIQTPHHFLVASSCTSQRSFPCTCTPPDVSPTSLRHIHGSCASSSFFSFVTSMGVVGCALTCADWLHRSCINGLQQVFRTNGNDDDVFRNVVALVFVRKERL